MSGNQISINEEIMNEVLRMVYLDEMNYLNRKLMKDKKTDPTTYCKAVTDNAFESVLDSSVVMDGDKFSNVAMKYAVDGYIYQINNSHFRLIYSVCSRYICKCVSLYNLTELSEEEIKKRFNVTLYNFAHQVFFWKDTISSLRSDELALKFIENKLIKDSSISYQQRCLDGVSHDESIKILLAEIEGKINAEYPQHKDITINMMVLVYDMFKKTICKKTFRAMVV